MRSTSSRATTSRSARAGDLTSAASFGIQTQSLFNAVTIYSTNSIEATGAGISASAQLGITIISTGDIVGGMASRRPASAAR
jgi:hypothetical protein